MWVGVIVELAQALHGQVLLAHLGVSVELVHLHAGKYKDEVISIFITNKF